jgi:hypothetical protein
MSVYLYKNFNNVSLVYPSQGYTKATPITCVAPLDLTNSESVSASKVMWYFGDGETQLTTQTTNFSTTHTYVFPGMYNISAVAYLDESDTEYSKTIVATASCKIINFIDNAVQFTVIPPPTIPGFYSQYPYKVIYTISNPDLIPKIDLYAEFTRSYPPQDPPNKWSFVRPEWKFTDKNRKKISYLTPEYEIIKIDSKGNISPDGTVVGISGTAEFYFIDDIYSVDLFVRNAPTPIIWATIETSAVNYYLDSSLKSDTVYGYGTTQARAYAPHTSYWKMPDYLRITENGMQDFIENRWTNAPIPFFVSIQLDSNQTGNISAYDPQISFAKYMPFAVSANGSEFIPCAEDINLEITVLCSVSATFDSSVGNNLGSYTFNQIDSTGFIAPGFTRGTVTVHDEGFIQLSAKAIIDFEKLNLPTDALLYSPYVWLPNPAAGVLSMVYYTGVLNRDFAEALNNQISTNAQKNIYAPLVNNINTTSPNMVDFNGLYAVAASPGSDPDYDYYAWVADADLDNIYKYNTKAELVTSIDLKLLTGKHKVTPASICMDFNKNIWVTCYDVLSVLKFNSSGEFLFAVDPSIHLPQVVPSVTGIFDPSPLSSIFDDVLIVEPTCIDVDTLNDVWISFSNPISSFLMKYSSTGTHITSIELPINSTPQDILIDRDNSFWVAESYEVYGETGTLKHYTSAGSIIEEYNNIPNLGYLTYDADGNPWFTYGYNKIGKIINNTFTHVAEVTSDHTPPEYESNINNPPLSGSDGYLQSVALEGIAGTHKNLIFVVHSIDNRVYIFDARNNILIDVINIAPQLMLSIHNDANKRKYWYQEWNKSIQVIGDWTGIRWSRKYKTHVFDKKIIEGVSKVLNVNVLNPLEIKKQNQDFNMTQHLKDIVSTSSLKNSSFLFNRVIQSIYGDGLLYNDIGTVFYEKIANFLSNHNDIDTCEIDKLYELAAMIDVSIDDYRLSFPAQLKQAMNLLTVTHSKLWGIKCKCNTNFRNSENCTQTDICKICGKCKLNNRGEKISETNLVKTDKPFVIYEKSIDSYFLHYPASINNLTAYSFNELTAIGLKYPIQSNYEFFEYIPTSSNFYTENTIDWDNPSTTLNFNMSTYQDWTESDGIIDTMLNFYLYNGLNLINK